MGHGQWKPGRRFGSYTSDVQVLTCAGVGAVELGDSQPTNTKTSLISFISLFLQERDMQNIKLVQK